uniref:Uncharacterized protein n=1 Tax=Anopheles dirus TaxID=7168 RepID=A0A182NEY6_9DIPT
MERIKSVATAEKQVHWLKQCSDIRARFVYINKFFSYFVRLLQNDCEYDDVYQQTLSVFEGSVVMSESAQRDVETVCKCLNVILELSMRPYVCQRVIVDSLGAMHEVIANLESEEVQRMLEGLVKKFNEERNDAYARVTEGFKDPSGRLQTMLQWKSETFEIVKCYYEGIIVMGNDAIEAFELFIDLVNQNELHELKRFLTPRIAPNRIKIDKSSLCETICDETVIRREKWYDSADLMRPSNLWKAPNDAKIPISTNSVRPTVEPPVPSSIRAESSVCIENVAPMVDGYESDASSVRDSRPLKRTWYSKLHEQTVKQQRQNLYDPYDIENMREYEPAQKKIGKKSTKTTKARAGCKENVLTNRNTKRSVTPPSSTPVKRIRRRPAVESKYIDDISSIGSDSYDSDSDEDRTYDPYIGLSSVQKNGRRSRDNATSGSRKRSSPVVRRQTRKSKNDTTKTTKVTTKTTVESPIQLTTFPMPTNPVFEPKRDPKKTGPVTTNDFSPLNGEMQPDCSMDSNHSHSMEQLRDNLQLDRLITAIDSSELVPAVPTQLLVRTVPAHQVPAVPAQLSLFDPTALSANVQRTLDQLVTPVIDRLEEDFREKIATAKETAQSMVQPRADDLRAFKAEYDSVQRAISDTMARVANLQKLAIQIKLNRKSFDDIDHMVEDAGRSDSIFRERLLMERVALEKKYKEAAANHWHQHKVNFSRRINEVLFPGNC